MDRNLGATRAGLQTNLLDGVRTFGLLYQGGRKDPFFCSADGTSSETKTIYDGYGKEVAIDKKKPTAYGYSVRSYTATIERPLTFYIYAQTSSEYPNAFKDVPDPWGGTSNKTLYDPCPQG